MEECLLMNTFPTWCWQGWGREGGQSNTDSCRQEEGGSEIIKNVPTSFIDSPLSGCV